KISPEEKIQWMEKIIQNKESISSVAAKTGVHYMTVDKWLRNYKSIGQDVFFRKGWTKRTTEEKESAVLDYLSGKGSLRNICDKHKIADTRQLRKWIMKYNGHEELKDSGTGGTPIMTKGRKTTFEERVEIVQYCINHAHNYAETAENFSISYQQARSYTMKYEEKGVKGLQDRRGKRKSLDEMDELEKLRAEVKILRAEKERAEMEVSFLKKLEEIERRRS
ncbi:MAG: helix-turn-helix domain-containing protein, partial [Lachnospiraceae bacterium]